MPKLAKTAASNVSAPQAFDLTGFLSKPAVSVSKPILDELPDNDIILDGSEPAAAPPQPPPQPQFNVIVDPEPEPEPQPEPLADHTATLSPEDMAAWGVMMLDFAQSGLFSWLHKQFGMHLTPEELELLPKLDKSADAIYDEDSPFYSVKKKWDKHLKISAKLPFTDAEIKALEKSGAIYARTMQVKVTPLEALMATIGATLTKRAKMTFLD